MRYKKNSKYLISKFTGEYVRKILIYSLILLFHISSTFLSQSTLIEKGADWKYFDKGNNLGTIWYSPNYDDSSWKIGKAELGYGDGDERTVVSYGPNSSNKYPTTYFRKKFQVSNISAVKGLLLKLLRDDGAVVYLNGKEVVRSNMNSGTITYYSYAASTVAGSDEDYFNEYYLDPTDLIEGTNTIAVEIHQRSASSSDISFNLELIATDTVPQISIVHKAPYLIYTGQNDEMLICWQLNKTTTSTLKWGTDVSYSIGNVITSEYGTDHQHKYKIQNLKVDQKYYYQIIANTDTISGEFRTGPATNSTNVTILAYGDTRSYPADHDKVAEQILNNINNDPSAETLLLVSGDLVSDGDNEAYWDSQFFSSNYPNIREMMGKLPYMACVGNHEGTGTLFKKYFPYEFYNSRFYFSFNYGPVHITVLDQYTTYSPGSTQYQWLENDLANSNKHWKIIVLHEPGWSGGGHSNDLSVQNYIQPLCEKYGVQLVICGHNHYYSRAVVENVYHITTGGGGAPLYNPNPSNPNIVAATKAHHFCKIKIENSNLVFSAIDKNRNLLDSFTIYNSAVGIEDNSNSKHNAGLPEDIRLDSIYPNPFNPATNIKFTLRKSSMINVNIFSSNGKLIKTLVNKNFNAGTHILKWNTNNNAGNVSSGVYFVQIKANKDIISKKIVLVK